MRRWLLLFTSGVINGPYLVRVSRHSCEVDRFRMMSFIDSKEGKDLEKYLHAGTGCIYLAYSIGF